MTPRWRTDGISFRRGGLLPKEVSMGAGADQVQFISSDAINQKPVRLDMSLPITLPSTPEWMIVIVIG